MYQYKALNFGLNVAPRIFSKILRYAIEPLRKQGIRMVYYLDDICLLSQDPQELEGITHKLIKHLEILGFILNRRKSLLTPSQTQEYLGFEFNTEAMKIKVPELKIKKLIQRIKQALSPKKKKKILPLGSKPLRESNSNVTDSGRSIASHQTLTEVVIEKSTSKDAKLGSTMPVIRNGHRGITMVDEVHNQKE